MERLMVMELLAKIFDGSLTVRGLAGEILTKVENMDKKGKSSFDAIFVFNNVIDSLDRLVVGEYIVFERESRNKTKEDKSN